MKSDADRDWTTNLQPAALAANIQFKRSTRYTPFCLMFGRDFDSANLLNLTNSSTDPQSDLRNTNRMEAVENIKVRANYSKENI